MSCRPPDGDQARLAALHALGILDTPPEERFDRITRLMSRHFGVPIAVVALIDADRVWFKSCVGLDGTESPRSYSFCDHALRHDPRLVLTDTMAHPEFVANPLVVGPPYIRFYAGEALRSVGGHVLGILCILDHAPRPFSEAEREDLADFAAMVQAELNVMSREVAADHREQFLGILSHELRTPINAITGFGSILADGLAGKLSGPQLAFAEKILVASDHMLALVNDLLDFSRMQAGRFAIDPEPMALGPVIAQVLDEQAQVAAACGLSLAADVPADLPMVAGDVSRIRQIVANLVSNAIKYSPGGGEVMVRVLAAEPAMRIEVQDTGVGIPPEAQARVFDAFMQVDMSSTRAVGGVGLGLAIVKALVEAHRGELGLTSEPGTGSTFWFTLPLAIEAGILA